MTRKAFYVLSTHWDREWYQPFQDYRYRLVKLIDRVLDGWQREDLIGPFQTDGQAIILEDYLEVRPEREEQIRELVRAGRFMVGPWYVMPDEFLVSGESLIRNLRLGRSTARRFGGSPSSAGFVCDIFGHNSQMPQIFAGFGIRGGFVWRGMNMIDARLFRWRGADGTELPCYRFGKIGYCSFAVQVRGARPNEPKPDQELAAQRLDAYLEEEDALTSAGPLLLFDGGDHMQWDEEVYPVLARRFGQADGRFALQHGSLDDYLNEMAACEREIPVMIEGELREPGRYSGGIDEQWLIPGVTSSRVWIKQANAACQNLLCQWAEPFSAFASAAIGLDGTRGFLNTAWRWQLMNHPHDSICGCSIDAVHADMGYRFHQAEQIGSRLTTEAMRALTASVEGGVEADSLRVGVFNPLARAFDGTADLELEVPADWPTFHETMGAFEQQPGFRIFDAQGQEIAYQRVSQSMNRIRFRTPGTVFPSGYRVNVTRVSLPLKIPALGYTTLTLRPAGKGEPTRLRPAGGLATSERSMENENLSVTVERDGALTITDKRSDQTFKRLLVFEDCADIGDGWNFGPAVNDMAVYSTGSAARVSLAANGPYQTTFQVRLRLELPEAFCFDSMKRSETSTNLQIDSLITLRAGADWVEVETTVNNTVKDHRLRVLFASGAQANTCLMDTPFDLVERNIALRADNGEYREQEVEFKPQQSFTAVYDRQRGLAVLSTGLMESAVLDLPERPAALTLLRATGRTVFTDGEPGGQIQGEQHFRIWVKPLTGEPDRKGLFDLSQLLSGGLRTAHIAAEDAALYACSQVLPAEAGFIGVEGPVVLTSLAQTETGTEARLFNPNTYPVDAALYFDERKGRIAVPESIQPVDLESNPIGRPVAVKDGRAAIPFGPKQIRTLRISA